MTKTPLQLATEKIKEILLEHEISGRLCLVHKSGVAKKVFAAAPWWGLETTSSGLYRIYIPETDPGPLKEEKALGLLSLFAYMEDACKDDIKAFSAQFEKIKNNLEAGGFKLMEKSFH